MIRVYRLGLRKMTVTKVRPLSSKTMPPNPNSYAKPGTSISGCILRRHKNHISPSSRMLCIIRGIKIEAVRILVSRFDSNTLTLHDSEHIQSK